MEDQNMDLREYVDQLFREKGREAIDFARKSLLETKTHCAEIHGALEHFIGYWNELARPSLMAICCEAVGGDPKKTIPFAASMTLICGATDVHDDIIDKSKRKLSHSTIYGKFGQDVALLVGDALLFKGFFILRDASDDVSTKEMAQIYNVIEELIFEMGYGEALELKLRRKLNVDLDKYLSLVKMKAADVEACARIGAILGSGSKSQINALGRYGRLLGSIVILRDDLADTFDPEEALQRFKNESLPFPILMALKDRRIRSKLSPILLKRKITKKDLETISEIIQGTDVVNRVEQLVNKMSLEAQRYVRGTIKEHELKTLIEAAVSL